MSLYRFLNVYESMRLRGLKNAFGKPEVLYPKGLNITKQKQGFTVSSNKEIKKLKQELDKKGNGYVKTIISYKGKFIIGMQKLKKVTSQEAELYKKDADDIQEKKINDVEDIKIDILGKVQNQELTNNQALSIFDQKMKKMIVEYQYDISKLREEIIKYKLGENVSALAVESYKNKFDLFSKQEVIETTNVIIGQQEKENFLQAEREHERNEKEKEILRLEKEKLEKQLVEKRKAEREKEEKREREQFKVEQEKKQREFRELLEARKNIPLLGDKIYMFSKVHKYGAAYFGPMGLVKTKYATLFIEIKTFISDIVSDNFLSTLNEYDIGRGENPIFAESKSGKKIAIMIKKYN